MVQPETQIDLSQLKDLHESLKPDFWPLASGWYILMVCLFFIFILFLFLLKKYQRMPLPYALKELEKIQKEPKNSQLKLISQLLKRVAMVRYNRQEIAPLSEDEWENFLLASADQIFSQKQAHDLAFSIYNPLPPNKELFYSCKKWIKFILKKRKAN